MTGLNDPDTSLVDDARPPALPEASLRQDLAVVAKLDIHGLRSRWRLEMRRPPPPDLPKFLLLRFLAYRLQARVLGDLDPQTQRMLARLAREEAGQAKGASSRQDQRRLKPGTLVVREWKGQLHRVTVLSDGYAWEGKTYKSLSKIARAITGTQWSGPRFFGLLRKQADRTKDAGTSAEDR